MGKTRTFHFPHSTEIECVIFFRSWREVFHNMGEMSYILFPYYQYIAEVIYMFFSLFLFKFSTQVDFSLVYDENFFFKKIQTQTEHVKSLHIVTSLILSLHLLSRSFWRRFFLWWALWRRRLLLWFPWLLWLPCFNYFPFLFHLTPIKEEAAASKAPTKEKPPSKRPRKKVKGKN